MNNKLFTPVQEGHDSKNRVVFICKDADGKFYVHKPQSGFTSRTWDAEDDAELVACFDRQKSCGHSHAFYNDGEKPVVEETPAADAKKPVAKKAAKPAVKKAAKPAVKKAAKPAVKKAADKTPATK